MEQSPSWEANQFSAFYRTQKFITTFVRPPTCPFPEPDQSSPWPPSHFLKIHFNVIPPSSPGSAKWSFFLSFPHQNPVYTSPLLHMCYMPHPSHSSQFDHQIIIVEEHRSFSSSLCSFLHYPIALSPLGPNILLSTLFSNTLSLRSCFNVSDQVSHPYKTGKVYYIYIYTLQFLVIVQWTTRSSWWRRLPFVEGGKSRTRHLLCIAHQSAVAVSLQAWSVKISQAKNWQMTCIYHSPTVEARSPSVNQENYPHFMVTQVSLCGTQPAATCLYLQPHRPIQNSSSCLSNVYYHQRDAVSWQQSTWRRVPEDINFHYFNIYTLHLLLSCTVTNKCTIISQIITLLHVSTLSCHPQAACIQYLVKLHQYFKFSCW